MTTKKTLTKDDWIAAGFRALARDGAGALRAEKLARDLGTTKGSFYWHFTDLAAFKAQMIAFWEFKVATEVMDSLNDESDPHKRLTALARAAADPAPQDFGGTRIEHAVRAWGLGDDTVAQAIAAVDARRISFLETLLAEVGLTTPHLAQVIYATHIGLDDLMAKHGQDKSGPFGALMTLLLSQQPP